MGETLENRGSLAAPMVFLIVIILQITPSFIGYLKKRGSVSPEQIQLRQEIKQLLKEATSMSNPSTFAQAAKLRRTAAAKEKELRKSQELHNKDNKLPYDVLLKALMVLKVISYLLLVVWFRRDPVATISHQFLQPLGRMFSWRARAPESSHIMVGIVPWLIISNRVSRYVCQKLTK